MDNLDADNDPITALHYAEVGKMKLPTAKEEKRLFTAYQAARRAEELGRTWSERNQGRTDRIKLGYEISSGYLRFVIQCAARRTRDSQLRKELISHGYIGLMYGITKFKVEKGYRFLTYGARWIQVHMQEHLRRLGVVHLANQARKNATKTKKTGGEVVEPKITSIENVSLMADEEVTTGMNWFMYMDQAELTRLESLLLSWSFGLRGTEKPVDDQIQLLFELDGSTLTETDVRSVRDRAVNKLREFLPLKGIHAVKDVI